MSEKEALETALNGLDRWLILFGMLVAIGVVGESVFGFIHWRKSNRLRVIDTAEILELRERAATAEVDPTLWTEKLTE